MFGNIFVKLLVFLISLLIGSFVIEVFLFLLSKDDDGYMFVFILSFCLVFFVIVR